MQVRYFMMLGNRGETAKTFKESLDFVRAAQPHQALFACLSIYPGTDDFKVMGAQWVDRSRRVLHGGLSGAEGPVRCQRARHAADVGVGSSRTVESATCTVRAWRNASRFSNVWADCTRRMWTWQVPTIVRARWTRRSITCAGRWNSTTQRQGLPHNYRACIAADRGDFDGMQQCFNEAASDPQHPVLVRNVQVARKWVSEGRTIQRKASVPHRSSRLRALGAHGAAHPCLGSLPKRVRNLVAVSTPDTPRTRGQAARARIPRRAVVMWFFGAFSLVGERDSVGAVANIPV